MCVTVIAECFLEGFRDSGFELIQRCFQSGDTEGFQVVIAATNGLEVNIAVAEEAKQNNAGVRLSLRGN